ncbi:MAG: thioredoxin [Rhodospirillaceae bacterium]|nr:thioredoxin [Rhodospirillaceae bacterium]
MTDETLTVTVDDGSFETEVLQAETPVLVDFWAEWCGPCRMVAPVVELLASEYQGRLKVTKLTVDESPQTAGAYSIRSIPTLLLFKDGEVQEAAVGAQPKAALARLIDRHVA